MRALSLHLNRPSRSGLSLGLRISAVIGAVSTLFYRDVAMIAKDALQTESMSYMLVVPFIFAYVIFRKRKMLRAVITPRAQNLVRETWHLPTLAGILLSAIAVLLYWYGSYTFTPLEYHILTLPIFVAGLTLIMFNYQTLRHMAFPIALLVLLVPPPSQLLYGLGATLAVTSAEASNTFMNALGIDSRITSEYGNPLLLITRSNGDVIPFAVNIACSGIYSLIGFFIFATFIGYIIRDRSWKKAAIFPIGLLLVYLLNIARIAIILLIGYQYGEEAALQIFHLLGGWVLIFLGTILLLAMTEKILMIRIFAKTTVLTQCHDHQKLSNSRSFCSGCGKLLGYPKAQLKALDLAKITVLGMAIVLLLSIQAPIFVLTTGPGEIILHTPAGEQAIAQILPQIQGYSLRFIFRDRNFEELAKQDASIIYAYMPNSENKQIIWITLEIASTRYTLHDWENCLIALPETQGYQLEVTQLDLRDIRLLENPPVIARYFAFKYTETNETQVVLYWFESSLFQANVTAQEKYVKTSVIAYLDSPEKMLETENLLATMATAIAQYWQPARTWTPISLIISQNGGRLSAITCGLLVVVIIFYAVQRRHERKANFDAYRKLSESSKQLIDAVSNAERAGTSMLQDIADQYQKITNATIDREGLLQKLSDAVRTGIVKSNVASQNDEPVLTWKT